MTNKNNPFKNYRESYYLNEKVKNPKIQVGKYSYYSGYHHGKDFEDCVWYLDEKDLDKDVDQLIIGKFCSIASGVCFLMGGNQGHKHDWISAYPLEVLEEDFDNYESTNPVGFEKKGDTVIGNDVWIGAESMFMPGIKVGNGAIIASRSVITKNVLPYTIVGGNPAKEIRKRFSDEEIEILENIRWWDWDIEVIKKHIHLLRSSNIQALKEANQ